MYIVIILFKTYYLAVFTVHVWCILTILYGANCLLWMTTTPTTAMIDNTTNDLYASSYSSCDKNYDSFNTPIDVIINTSWQ